MRHAPASPPVKEFGVQQFEAHSTSEDAVAQWHAVAVAVAQIGLQSALEQPDVSMDSENDVKGASPVSRAQRDVSKSSLWFILDDDEDLEGFNDDDVATPPPTAPAPLRLDDFEDLEEKPRLPLLSTHTSPIAALLSSSQDTKHESSATSSEAEFFMAIKRRKVRQASATPAAPVSVALDSLSTMPPPKRTERKRKARRRPPSRICKFEGCEQYVVDQGLCVRHGGGKRCQTEGCTSRAKHQGKCWKHGGSTACKVVGCPNRAKSRGYCWSHGGGTKCKTGSCEKIAISNGLCWAHGGGKRCIIDGCKRQAYERTQNYCNTHYSELSAAAEGGAHDREDEDHEADVSENQDIDPENEWKFAVSASHHSRPAGR